MADTTPNELYTGWLKEWMDQAQERNSKGYLVYAQITNREMISAKSLQVQESMAIYESLYNTTPACLGS